MSKDNGGPAFPVPFTTTNDLKGMTLRDYFAAKAMQGLANGAYAWRDLAGDAYKIADAMLEARK